MPQIIFGTGPITGTQPAAKVNLPQPTPPREQLPPFIPPKLTTFDGMNSTIDLITPPAPATSVTAHDDLIS